MSGISSKQTPLVSVVIPTHNRARSVQAAIASVFAQHGLGEQFDVEVIVVDDASSDDTPETLRRYPGVRYLRLETNQGLSAARNAGLKVATGKYVAFLDDDDLWLPGGLMLQVPTLEADPEVAVGYSQWIWVLENDVWLQPRSDAPSGRIFRTLVLGDITSTFGVLFPRSAFQKAGFFDESISYAEDWDMLLRLAVHYPFRFIPGPVGVYLASTEGMLATRAAQGNAEREIPRVLERALADLPDGSKDDIRLKEEALAHMELNLAAILGHAGEPAKMELHLLRALKKFPWVTGESWARNQITNRVVLSAMASRSPISTARSSCEQMKRAAGGVGFRGRLEMRRLLANVWAGVAFGLGPLSGNHRQGAASAAARAILLNPWQLRRKKLRSLLMGGGKGPWG